MTRRTWILPTFLLVASVAIAAALWVHGASFYLTTGWDRPDHPAFASLRSSGSFGHGLGLAGTAIILVNLSFLARRHLGLFRRFGALRTWLNSHVITGLFGPLVIVYHSAFDPRSTVAITAAASLGVLVLTGVLGRFIYSLVPHTVAGAELGREDLERRVAEARAEVATALGADDPLWAELDALSARPPVVPGNKVVALFLLPLLVLDLARTRGRVRRLVRRSRRHLADAATGNPTVALTDLVILRRRLHTLTVTRQLLRWWRGLHRVFAVLMIVTVAVHVGVTLYFGYSGGLG